MRSTSKSRTLFLLLAAACSVLSCGRAAEPTTITGAVPEASAPQGPDEKYVGVWRSSKTTLLIKREGAAFVVSTDGPAGEKEVGTFESGVLKIGMNSALYTPSNDHVVVGGEEFTRIDPREQTLTDLRNIALGIPKYAAAYTGPPINDMDFFHGLPTYVPRFSRRDGWGTEYRYLYKVGQPHWAVVSAGPDGLFDERVTAAQIANGYGGTQSDDIVLADGQIDGVDHKF